MKRLLVVVGLVVLGALAVWAQPNTAPDWPFGGTLGDVQRRIEYDENGDHIRVNLRGLSATPTPADPNRCVVIADAVSPSLRASCNGGPYQILATDSGNGCDCPGTGAHSTASGATATGPNTNATAFGAGTSAQADDAIAIGAAAINACADTTLVGVDGVCVGGADNVIVGDGAIVAGAVNGVCLGAAVSCAGSAPVCIGQGASCSNGGNCIGRSCTEATANRLGIGSATVPIQNVCLGHGCLTTAEGVAGLLRPSDLSGGVDKDGGSLQLRGGAGTGAGRTGNIQLRYCPPGASGSASNSLSCVTAWQLDGTTGTLQSNDHDLNLPELAAITFGDASEVRMYYDSTVHGGALVINPGTETVEVLGDTRVDQLHADTGGVINEGQNTLIPEQADITSAAYQFDVTNVPAFFITANGSYTLTSEPTLTDGQNGQMVWIWNVDGADTITFNDDGNGGVASNLQLGAATRALSQNDGLCLVYLGPLGDWLECGFVNN